ncbi:MAG: dynamin family protein [Pirellulaceae bacterium]|nr:dynamin family protein [Pirellulaceae bacterium]
MLPKSSTASSDHAIEQLRDQLLRPIADRFGFPLSKRTGATSSIPTVLCLGNHSSGKSSFINHWLGRAVQNTGVAPTDDGFTVLLYGPSETDLDGRAAVVDPQLPLRDFEQFGKEFLDRLKIKQRPLEPLRDLCLIDSPGLIDHAGNPNDLSRGYDFQAVVREFAAQADLIVFFFDPEKPGTTGESLRIFTEALSDVMYKLLIVFNKVDTFADVRDFARTYGALCWNLSRVVRTKDMPHIYCTFVEELAGARQRQIDLTDFSKSTQELKSEVARVGDRRRSNVIGALLDATRCLRLHGAVSHKIGVRLMAIKLLIVWASLLAIGVGIWLLWYHRSQTTLAATGVVAIVSGAVLVTTSRWFLRKLLQRQVDRLDATFHEIFHQELLTQSDNRFLNGLWESVKPRTKRFLLEVGPRGIPCSPLWPRRFRRLQRASEHDIPQMLRQVSHGQGDA